MNQRGTGEDGSERKECHAVRVKKIQLSDLSTDQVYKIRLLREALEQLVGHAQRQTMKVRRVALTDLTESQAGGLGGKAYGVLSVGRWQRGCTRHRRSSIGS